MTTEAEDQTAHNIQTALLKRCHDTVTAFSEREFERNVGQTYVPGCTPPSLAKRAESLVSPDPKKRPYREAAHIGGQGIILAQSPTEAIERAYVDQPVCKPPGAMVPMSESEIDVGGDPIRTAHWGHVRSKSKRESNLNLDYGDEPTIKCATPTEYKPITVPKMPDPNDCGPQVLQNAIADHLENSQSQQEQRFMPSATPNAIIETWKGIAHDITHWKNVPGSSTTQKLKLALMDDGRLYVIIMTSILIVLAIFFISFLLKTIQRKT